MEGKIFNFIYIFLFNNDYFSQLLNLWVFYILVKIYSFKIFSFPLEQCSFHPFWVLWLNIIRNWRPQIVTTRSSCSIWSMRSWAKLSGSIPPMGRWSSRLFANMCPKRLRIVLRLSLPFMYKLYSIILDSNVLFWTQERYRAPRFTVPLLVAVDGHHMFIIIVRDNDAVQMER